MSKRPIPDSSLVDTTRSVRQKLQGDSNVHADKNADKPKRSSEGRQSSNQSQLEVQVKREPQELEEVERVLTLGESSMTTERPPSTANVNINDRLPSTSTSQRAVPIPQTSGVTVSGSSNSNVSRLSKTSHPAENVVDEYRRRKEMIDELTQKQLEALKDINEMVTHDREGERVKLLEKEKEKMAMRIEMLVVERDTAERRIHKFEKEREQQRQKYRDCQERLNKKRKLVEKNMQERDILALETRRLGDGTRVVQEQLKRSEEEIVALTTRLEEKYDENLMLKSQVAQIHGEAELLRRERAMANCELAEVKGKMKNLQADLDTVVRRHSQALPRKLRIRHK
ncbi:hypothetical protein E1B28_002162 [Marasmius oreades]|uniref:Uncharacterized protein n=1 Tax=Marasmius oreades TaxID=181124 RepID=A0A9P7RMB9_9AGAR|nr:uncharacterized protein E1B28_002162 [Marasmius oreades]KAG7086199.1 hypothetical protein E1B28_002162 [Marasmius oreades]